jgi:hypothetical protein
VSIDCGPGPRAAAHPAVGSVAVIALPAISNRFDKEVEMRVARVTLGAAAAMCMSLLIPAAVALGASAPAGGKINVFVTPTVNGPTGKIVVTGAIGDYGKTLNVNKNGKTDNNGSYVKITLQQGSFLVNATKLDAKLNHLKATVNKATCSVAASGSGPVSLSDGTGLYTGISGNLQITVTFAFIGPRLSSGPHKGQCNGSNNAPALAQYQSITGSGTVSFS